MRAAPCPGRPVRPLPVLECERLLKRAVALEAVLSLGTPSSTKTLSRMSLLLLPAPAVGAQKSSP